MSEPPRRKNIFLTDENVDGPAIKLAREFGVEIIRNVDIDIPCEDDFYDGCLFDYAVEHTYILVTGNNKHFEPQFYHYAESGKDHPGLILIQKDHRRSSRLIADWLALWSEENLTNRLQRLPPAF